MISILKNNHGFHLIELLVAITIIAVLSAITYLIFDPREMANKARDAQRLEALDKLKKSIIISTANTNLLFCARGHPPCSGNSNDTDPAVRKMDGTGWVKINLSDKNLAALNVLPIDPVNSDKHHFIYYSDGTNWEIDVALESRQMRGKMSSDGGNDDDMYEIGSNLLVLKTSQLKSPIPSSSTSKQLVNLSPLAANPMTVSKMKEEKRIIVKYKSGVTDSEKSSIRQDQDTILKGEIDPLNSEIVQASANVTDTVDELQQDSGVQYAEEDNVAVAAASFIPDDTYFSKQWSLPKIDATNAWGKTRGLSDVTIAIVDSGVDTSHQDLANKVIKSVNFTTDGNSDAYGHGTYVAGIAAAVTNNGVGVAGINHNARLLSAKVLGDNGYGYYSWVSQGIIWAADNGANIINLSLGGTASSQLIQDAVNYAWSKGAVVVAAAGNNGNTEPFYPAYYSNVVSVGATDESDKRASFSDYGPWVSLAAPGVSIISTYKGGYTSASGTSAASPIVAGLAALIKGQYPAWSNQQIVSQIKSTSDKITGTGTFWANGRVNACKAVDCSGLSVNPSPTGIGTTAPLPTPSPVACSLTSASWSAQTVTQGTSVGLDVSGNTACANKQVILEVRRYGSISLDDVPANSQPSPVTLNSSGQGSNTWIAEHNPLIPGTHPDYYFKATVAGGNTIVSSDPKLRVTTSVTPTPTPAPTPISLAPGTLGAVPLNSTSININWGAASGPAVGFYEIYQNNKIIRYGNVLDLTVKNLAPSTTYSFYVVPGYITGVRGSASNIVTVSTLAKDPEPLTKTGVPCVQYPPSISISPSYASGKAGQTFNFSAAVTNNNRGDCPSNYFSVFAGQRPAGWSNPKGYGVWTTPGKTTTISYQIAAPPAAAKNTYEFSLWAMDALTGANNKWTYFRITIY